MWAHVFLPSSNTVDLEVNPPDAWYSQYTPEVGFAQDIGFDSVFGHEAVYMHVSSLADAMSSIGALSVHCWVPIEIVEDDSICACKIDAKAAGAGGEDEAKDPRVIVEAVGENLTLFNLCRTI